MTRVLKSETFGGRPVTAVVRRDIFWRFPMRTLTVYFLGLCAACTCTMHLAHETSACDTGKKKDDRKVTLKLVSALAKHVDGSDCVLICRVVVKNNSGAPLRVKSRFFSAFDGLDLVIMDQKGKKLGQQSYIFHQSPMAEEREYILRTGTSKGRLAFDLRDLPMAVDQLQVRLVGTLPGSGYEPALTTKAVPVKTPRK